ncbi:MAG: hypothetical protein LBQ38_04950, partial [Spirochaetaceae bacterium]|nr:hypothetical protein [Spirochaetaceae bacterium]
LGLFIARGQDLDGVGAALIGVSNSGSVDGVQLSGIYRTIEGDLSGIQAFGIYNTIGGNLNGIQAAGVFNSLGGAGMGIQGAGIFNTAGDSCWGIQASGIFNMVRGDLHGTQAGLVNITRGETHGVQLGLYNRNSGGDAFQAGLINVSRGENTDAVVSLGLVNIITNGILHPALYLDDKEFMNVSFRSGSKYFYSIFMAGDQGLRFGSEPLVIGGKKDRPLVVSRVGIGVELPLEKVFFDLDVLAGSFFDVEAMENWDEGVSNNVQARLTAGFNLFKHLGFFAGFSYDYIYRLSDSSPSPGGHNAIYHFEDDRHIHRIGFFGGVQF